MEKKPRRGRRAIPRTLRDFLIYMRILRYGGQDNYLMRRLAPGQRAEGVVEFLLDKGYQTQVKEAVDTIVISDIHLGSKHSFADALRRALARFEFKRLVLNGDIFDHLDLEVEELTPSHQAFLRELEVLSKTHEVVWIRGNHDDELSEFLPTILDAPVHEEYVWNYQGKRYLALHGDQFDKFGNEHPFLYFMGTRFYQMLQWIGPSTRRLCAYLKRTTKSYTQAINLSTRGALAYAQARNIDFVLCGHTHNVYQKQEGQVSYFNSGGWTESPCHLIAIGEKGVRIHAFTEQGDYLGVAA